MTKPLFNKLNSETKQLLNDIYKVAEESNLQIYVVGGFVRDLLLGSAGKDIDFVIVGDALNFVKDLYHTYQTSEPLLYPNFGTAMLQFRGYSLEFVSARKEYYDENSRKPNVERADLFTDLSRRDFTINTLAMQIDQNNFGKMIDPYVGIKDLSSGIIKTPLNPEITFSDDPLRMMRAIRFASTLSFKIEKNTFSAIKKAADRLSIISRERITNEFNKILLSENPTIGIKLLDSSGLLALFLPEFVSTKGTEQKKMYHHKDVFYHTLQVIDQISKDTDKLSLRLAAMLHDIAKPKTKRFSDESGWTFHGHEIVGERMAETILKRMKYPNEIINYVKKMVRLHLRPMALVSEEVTDSAIRRLLFLAGEDFDDLMMLCRADITSKNPGKVKQYLKNYEIVVQKAIEVEERDNMRAFKSPVNGREIMEKFNLSPGPLVGKMKLFIEEAILDGIIPNDHDSAWEYLKEHSKEFLKLKQISK